MTVTKPRGGVSSARSRAGGSIDYAAIAAKKMRDPGTRHPRYLIYGRNKQGKTGMLKDTPNLLVIDPENGSHWLPSRPDLKVWPVNNWADINPAFRYLELGNHPFEFVGTTYDAAGRGFYANLHAFVAALAASRSPSFRFEIPAENVSRSLSLLNAADALGAAPGFIIGDCR